MMSWPEAWAEIWEKSASWVPGSEQLSGVLASEEDGWLSALAKVLHRLPHLVVVVVGGGQMGKSS